MTPENTPEQPDTTPPTVPSPVVEEVPPEPVAAEIPPPQPETPQEPDQWQPEKHRFDSIGILVATVAGVLLALYAFRLPPFGLGEVYTNNAYVRGNITVVSPRVSGYVQNVLVRDFDTVKAGQPLVEIDRAPYLSKVEQAKAGILAQQAALDKTKQDRASAQSAAKAGQAAIANAQAVLDRANREWKRIKGVSNDAISQSSRDAAQIAVKQAEAALTQAKEQYAIAQQNILNAGVGREGAAIDNAKAMLALAEQELGHTTVYAPADGLLGEVAVKKGQLVSAGTQLMSVVPAARWIVANIKETDMKNIRSGQQADITVDALGGAHFSGSISEIAPATASEFSIIKADSGTGNFVKIAQRIVVKIELHPGQTDLHKLAPGMSVEVRIGTRQK